MTAVSSQPGAFAVASTTADIAVNIVAFQAGWFACVLGAAYGWPWAGTAIAVAIVASHMLRAARPAAEFRLLAAVVLTGALWDSSLVMLGWLEFVSGTLIEGMAPHWILAMWALLATTLNVSLAWLKGRWYIAALLGAAAGPLAYWAGARLGAVVLIDPVRAMVALGVGWALMLPLLMAFARRYDGVHAAPAAKNVRDES